MHPVQDSSTGLQSKMNILCGYVEKIKVSHKFEQINDGEHSIGSGFSHYIALGIPGLN